MSLEKAAEEYFGGINSIARRMYVDMNETKLTYEELWDTISEKQKKEILSDSIIAPEVLIQYKQNEDCDKREYAVKVIIDDHCSYQDEHSGPFSFKTLSQRDLTIFEKEKPVADVKPKTKAQPIYIEVNQKEDSHTNSLPKTGLDFLDNW